MSIMITFQWVPCILTAFQFSGDEWERAQVELKHLANLKVQVILRQTGLKLSARHCAD